jgi:UDP-N-acetylglucosamine acyltransferase
MIIPEILSRFASSVISTPESMVHRTAIIHPGAKVHSTVKVGPYSVIGPEVVIGPECEIAPHVHITGNTVIGAQNRFHTGCVVGDLPQDLTYRGEPTRVRIGDENIFREHVTVHSSNKLSDATVIGSQNLLMAHSHVGHNSVLGDRVIMANGALLAGHVVVEDRAFISGHCLVHQFVRIGALSLMQGGAGVSKDLPPYTIARGVNAICGLNIVGLRRAGFTSEQRLEIKRLYHALFRSGMKMAEALAAARKEFFSEEARRLLDFVASSKRGVCLEASERPPSGESSSSSLEISQETVNSD